MDTRRLLSRRIIELAVVFSGVVGVGLIVASAIIGKPSNVGDILGGLGLALFPSALVALFINRFSSEIAESLLNENLKEAVGANLSRSMEAIERTVKGGLTKIDGDIQTMVPVFVTCARRGVESIHLNRGSALEKFNWFLDQEVAKGASGRVWIVGSSIKGLVCAEGEYFSGKRFLVRLASSGCNIRFMLTNSEMADTRATQEGRSKGEIPHELDMSLAQLKRIGIRRDDIKLYPSTPTVFSIVTTDRMLLNPYPYEAEAFACFSMVVYKTLDAKQDVFHQYLEYHFEKPWNRGEAVPPTRWGDLR